MSHRGTAAVRGIKPDDAGRPAITVDGALVGKGPQVGIGRRIDEAHRRTRQTQGAPRFCAWHPAARNAAFVCLGDRSWSARGDETRAQVMRIPGSL